MFLVHAQLSKLSDLFLVSGLFCQHEHSRCSPGPRFREHPNWAVGAVRVDCTYKKMRKSDNHRFPTWKAGQWYLQHPWILQVSNLHHSVSCTMLSIKARRSLLASSLALAIAIQDSQPATVVGGSSWSTNQNVCGY